MIGLFYLLVKNRSTFYPKGEDNLPRGYDNPKQTKSTWWIWCLIALALGLANKYGGV